MIKKYNLNNSDPIQLITDNYHDIFRKYHSVNINPNIGEMINDPYFELVLTRGIASPTGRKRRESHKDYYNINLNIKFKGTIFQKIKRFFYAETFRRSLWIGSIQALSDEYYVVDVYHIIYDGDRFNKRIYLVDGRDALKDLFYKFDKLIEIIDYENYIRFK